MISVIKDAPHPHATMLLLAVPDRPGCGVEPVAPARQSTLTGAA